MKSMFIVFVVVFHVLNGHVECKSDFSGFEFNEPVDYNTACGEPFDGEFPWLVTIHKAARNRFTTSKAFQCNGNIIDKYTVLLPAHCVNSVDPRILFIEVGKLTFTGRTAKTREYTCRDVIVHPDFNLGTFSDDIAILKLSDPIEFSSYVHPICLTNNMSKFNKTQSGVVPVWTYLNEERNEDVLNSVYLPIIYNNTDCAVRDPQFFSVFLNDRSFCVGNITESYILLSGAVGVGLALIEETRIKFIWYLKGMLSMERREFNFAWRQETAMPGTLIFTDIFKYYDWINENKNNE